MNFITILKALFKGKPSLDQFIEIHDPKSVEEVENLIKQYDRLMTKSAFYC